MFCIVFGLSMDYEVLMLFVHEEWERTGDNTLAVANSEDGGLITSGRHRGFGAWPSSVVQQIGLGLAPAIFIDATLVRALVVPATMRRWASGTGGRRRSCKGMNLRLPPPI